MLARLKRHCSSCILEAPKPRRAGHICGAIPALQNTREMEVAVYGIDVSTIDRLTGLGTVRLVAYLGRRDLHLGSVPPSQASGQCKHSSSQEAVNSGLNHSGT